MWAREKGVCTRPRSKAEIRRRLKISPSAISRKMEPKHDDCFVRAFNGLDKIGEGLEVRRGLPKKAPRVCSHLQFISRRRRRLVAQAAAKASHGREALRLAQYILGACSNRKQPIFPLRPWDTRKNSRPRSRHRPTNLVRACGPTEDGYVVIVVTTWQSRSGVSGNTMATTYQDGITESLNLLVTNCFTSAL
jgi:hypothetical protein